jgi:hypothetical protein
MSARKAAPALIVMSGERTVMSYEGFLSTKNPLARTQYGSTARRFFGWAEGRGLALETIKSGHIKEFHERLLCEHGHAAAYSSSLTISSLFDALVADGIVADNPVDGAEIKSARPIKHLRNKLIEDCGADDDEGVIDAILVMVSPMQILSFSVKAIRSYTQLSESFVERVSARLYDQGIWGRDESILGEWLNPDADSAIGYVSLVMDGWTALGRFDRNENIQYSLPLEAGMKYRRKRPSQTKKTMVLREEKRETVTVREFAEEIVYQQ